LIREVVVQRVFSYFFWGQYAGPGMLCAAFLISPPLRGSFPMRTPPMFGLSTPPPTRDLLDRRPQGLKSYSRKAPETQYIPPAVLFLSPPRKSSAVFSLSRRPAVVFFIAFSWGSSDGMFPDANCDYVKGCFSSIPQP